MVEAFADDDPEWFSWAQLRPHPPGTPGGEGWCQTLKKGDHVDMFHEEAWWEMEVRGAQRSRRAAGDPPRLTGRPMGRLVTLIWQVRDVEHERLSRTLIFSLYSLVHGDEHQVEGDKIRPHWKWKIVSKTSLWRQEKVAIESHCQFLGHIKPT